MMNKTILVLFWGLSGWPLFAQTGLSSADSAILEDARLAAVDRSHLLGELHVYNEYMGAAGATVDKGLLPARIKSFILIHPDYWISLLKFGELVQTGGISKAAARFGEFPSELRQSSLGRSVLDIIHEEEARLGPGKMAPGFRTKTAEGKEFLLDALRGSYVLLDFWASWCGPCRQENPNIVENYHRFRDKGLTVVSFSLDENKASWLAAISADHLDWLHVSDLQGWHSEVVRTYMVAHVPQNFLIDPEGKIVAVDLRGDELRKVLEKIFNQ